MRYYLRCGCLRFAIAIYRYPRELALHSTIVIVARLDSIEQYSFLHSVHILRYSILHNPLSLCTLHLSVTAPSSFPIPNRHNRHSLSIPNILSTHLPHSHKIPFPPSSVPESRDHQGESGDKVTAYLPTHSHSYAQPINASLPLFPPCLA